MEGGPCGSAHTGPAGPAPGGLGDVPRRGGPPWQTADTRPLSRESATRRGHGGRQAVVRTPRRPLPRASAPAQRFSKQGPVLLESQFLAPFQKLFYKPSGGFSVSLPRMFLPQKSRPTSLPSLLHASERGRS